MDAPSWISTRIADIADNCVAAHESVLKQVWSGVHVDFGSLDRRGFALGSIDPTRIANSGIRDFRDACEIFFARLQQIREWRARLATSGDGGRIYEVAQPSGDPFHAVLLHHEVDQTIHCIGLRISSEDTVAQNLAGAMYGFARQRVFAMDARIVEEFCRAVLDRDELPREALDRDCLRCVLTLAHHTPAHPEVHPLFKRALKRIAGRDPAAWLFFLRFEDFLANHRLSGKRQILGTFAVKTEAGVKFDPPLEDWDLANKLRKRFGLEDLDTFLEEEEGRLALAARWHSAAASPDDKWEVGSTGGDGARV